MAGSPRRSGFVERFSNSVERHALVGTEFQGLEPGMHGQARGLLEIFEEVKAAGSVQAEVQEADFESAQLPYRLFCFRGI